MRPRRPWGRTAPARLEAVPSLAWPRGGLALLARCGPVDPGRARQDRPAVTLSDGSVLYASTDEGVGHLTGRPVRDLGGGRVGQVIEAAAGCFAEQSLLVVGCTRGAAILVRGARPEPAAPPGLSVSTRALQPPHGPLALGPSTTVAAGEGWAVEADVAAWAVAPGEISRTDPLFGCALLHPGSAGAAARALAPPRWATRTS